MNKTKILTILIGILCLSCQPESKKIVTETKVQKKIETAETKPSKAIVEDHLSDFSKLYPIEIVDSTKQNPFEKFGIEFTGNCYSCDLTEIKINKKQIDFINVCEETEFLRLNNNSYTSTQNELKINTDDTTLIFEKIDNAPVYRLILEGKKLNFEKNRISEYYTFKKLLKKFTEHDCGDFQG